ncbi:MAG TPA: TrkA family potassium uptake protein [Flexivirga sp.]|uniref:potassium channel family protein n=1 Tax=Flexivirga sp. TaxID=1962927 RepID=UPI002C4D30BE|nr:TrkA family potassium uptake protein [Flexivirga sp.]HWC24762.1 TrkA family potassium uptake protein [Flexivirga sp.]
MSAKRRGALDPHSVLVIGLGRFGTAVSATLTEQDWDVLAVDQSLELVQKWSDQFTHVVQADSSDVEALRQIGAGDFERAVVAIGSNLEASILTTANLADLGVPSIWAKAMTKQHARILQRIGAHHVVLPEREMGARIGRLLVGSLADYYELESGFGIGRMSCSDKFADKTLAQLDLRARYGVTVVAVKHIGGTFEDARPETPIKMGDQLVITGSTERLQQFSGRA